MMTVTHVIKYNGNCYAGQEGLVPIPGESIDLSLQLGDVQGPIPVLDLGPGIKHVQHVSCT